MTCSYSIAFHKMAVNNYGTNLRVVTNVQGNIVDNDEYVATRAAYEHNNQAKVEPTSSQRERLKVMYAPEIVVEEDPALIAANIKDLKNRNL